MPYCDNLTIIGTDRIEVQRGLESMMQGFTSKGFTLHEVSHASAKADVLAGTVLGRHLTVLGKRPTVWKVRAALFWLAGGPVISGEQLQVVLGHFIPPRAVLSVVVVPHAGVVLVCS